VLSEFRCSISTRNKQTTCSKKSTNPTAKENLSKNKNATLIYAPCLEIGENGLSAQQLAELGNKLGLDSVLTTVDVEVLICKNERRVIWDPAERNGVSGVSVRKNVTEVLVNDSVTARVLVAHKKWTKKMKVATNKSATFGHHTYRYQDASRRLDAVKDTKLWNEDVSRVKLVKLVVLEKQLIEQRALPD